MKIRLFSAKSDDEPIFDETRWMDRVLQGAQE
jgi:hypothetical protein